MNWLDIAVVAAIAWFTLAAFSTGVLREGAALTGALAGAVVAGHFYPDLAQDLESFTESVSAAKVIAFAAIFTSVVLAGHLASLLLKPVAALLTLGWVDNVAGALLGLAKGLVLAEVFFIVTVTYPYWGLDQTIHDSALASFFLDRAPLLLRLLPGEFQGAVDAFSF